MTTMRDLELKGLRRMMYRRGAKLALQGNRLYQASRDTSAASRALMSGERGTDMRGRVIAPKDRRAAGKREGERAGKLMRQSNRKMRAANRWGRLAGALGYRP